MDTRFNYKRQQDQYFDDAYWYAKFKINLKVY